MKLTERSLHLIPLLPRQNLVQDLASEDLGLPSPLIIDHTTLVRFLEDCLIEEEGELMDLLVEVLAVGLDPCDSRCEIDVGMVKTHIFAI